MSKKCLATLSRRWQTGANGAWRDKRRHFFVVFAPVLFKQKRRQRRSTRRKKDGSRSGTSPAIRIPKHRRTEAQEDGRRQKKRCSKTIRKRSQTRSASSSSYVAGGDHSKHTSPCPPVYAGDAIEKKGLSLRSGVRAFEGSVSGIL